MRRYYLHARKGVYYAELVTPEGRRLSARSTKKTTEDEALLVVADWLKNGVPTGRKGAPRPADVALGLDGVLRAIRKIDLNGNDAMRIVTALKDRGLVDVSATGRGEAAPLFPEFLLEFWNYEKSPYVREKQAHGQSSGFDFVYLPVEHFQL
jgi:hypothetical protein